MSIPLPYHTLKGLHASKEGISINPFFGRWTESGTLPEDLQPYRVIIDVVGERVYDHPFVTSAGMTAPARYFTRRGEQLAFSETRALIYHDNASYVTVGTVEGNYLVIAPKEIIGDERLLASRAYKAWVKDTCAAPANRAVTDTDRQVHWVWFRKSPAYRLTEEIVLRAASWIELNPGYTFHLWTSVVDAEEMVDFLADLPHDVRSRYFDEGRITVHYREEFRQTVFDWLDEQMPELVGLFTTVWNSTERQDIVMKTDYTRNILLAARGGIYTDFNDLLCLGPIEPVLEAHAGRCIGVTDNTTLNNASNYFMYAGADSEEWRELTKECTATLPRVYGVIHNAEVYDVVCGAVREMASGRAPTDAEVVRALNQGFPEDGHQVRHFIHAIAYAIELTKKDDTALSDLLRRSAHGRYKPSFIADVTNHVQRIGAGILDDPAFEATWRFAITDIYLRSIMYRTNLPIFCRQQNKPMYMLPFGYLLRYGCLLSFVGHLGDGTSYGSDPANRAAMRNLLGCKR
jgi:hypothetical protein